MNIEKKEIRMIADKMFEIWNQRIQSGDPEKVAELYTDEDAFLPTLSGKYPHSKEGTIEYFQHFLAKKPIGKIIVDDVRGDDNFVIHSGFYNFEVDSKDKDGEREIVEARFTFVYQKILNDKEKKDEWKIYHHHSSLKP